MVLRWGYLGRVISSFLLSYGWGGLFNKRVMKHEISTSGSTSFLVSNVIVCRDGKSLTTCKSSCFDKIERTTSSSEKRPTLPTNPWTDVISIICAFFHA